MNYLIPTVVDGKLHDGNVIQAVHKCKKKYCEHPCKEFYEKISNMPEGFYICPSGYSVYQKKNKEVPVFL